MHRSCRPSRSPLALGFTLIEVMVTVAVVAILGAVALPSYRDYVTRGRIPEATAGLAERQVRMEQFFQDNRTYAGALACTVTAGKFFTFSCTAASATAFELTATGTGSMSGFTYTVDQAGTKKTTAVPAGWSLPSPNNCWVTKKGGLC
ncbi:prepilin-type N-terminal cleavage/methylation domain-containing protein [Inhella sp. 1Y17]|uniref:Prepilin-type N-terminal cleavage/methylation domain-containing protein n=2 Tax=Inhella proteolytica TaxID=2795029 RepID=A0A931NFD9_9BURK|nr:prepilin-type N-terminal cleavage/methylation domain-containing protein [Inhella proteolytica]